MKWTESYFGVSHLGKFSCSNYWVTIVNYGRFVLLFKHFPGCGFFPIEETYKNINSAQKAGCRYHNKHNKHHEHSRCAT